MSEALALARPFGTLPELVRAHAAARPAQAAIVDGERRINYAQLDARMDRIAAGLQRQGLVPGDRLALCGDNSLDYAVAFLGALRAGVVAALIPPRLAPGAIDAMVADSGAKVALRGAAIAAPPEDPAPPAPVQAAPEAGFNIIYSSGTTGAPKGIVQPNSMRWVHMQRALAYGYGPESVTLLSTPLYSNTTLVSFFPALAMGGTVVLMAKFDPETYLANFQRHRVTHTMLVPVQYQRLMAFEGFGRYDLASTRMKLSTSAPFRAPLKEQVLERWPGGLVEYYGMTEGGATCVLAAHVDRHKLHTVGRPGAGVEVRLIDEEGREVAPGAAGEIVGRSGAMMTGYHNRPRETAEAEWHDAAGRRFIRTGDVGRLDEDGFLVLVDRRKDVIISGGFNIYPSDLEAVLRGHPGVRDVAVAGVPSERWGETPVAFVVAAPGTEAEALRAWANERVGNVQRLAAVELVDELPRSAIGKVLKRELRDAYLREITSPPSRRLRWSAAALLPRAEARR
ncbi:MAG TPA: AMP-binding protein [Usitatibacter sp.]|nr:AMP-binding protein [Usitatibacter sp.]